MKKLLLWLVAFISVAASAAQAQDLTGTWQGTLSAARPLRVVIKITNADGASLRAVMYSIDQGGQGVAASAVSVQGTSVKLTIAAANATYEGKVSADGNAITGTFTQGSALTLNLVRASADTAWTIPTPPAAATPMPATARPVFEVATIKPSDPNAQGRAYTMRGRQVMTINTTAKDLISFAYEVHQEQISGAAGWTQNDRFNVTGQPDIEGLPSVGQMRLMVQKLLTDRFKLAFHREKKELSVYALTVGPKGPTLTRSEGDGNGLPSLMFRGLGNLPARNATMADFANVMQSAVLDRPVVDQTGLAGRYDFSLIWTPDETQFVNMGVRVPPPSPDSNTPGLFTAVQQQLGLKFDATRAPVETIVIDGIERPTEN